MFSERETAAGFGAGDPPKSDGRPLASPGHAHGRSVFERFQPGGGGRLGLLPTPRTEGSWPSALLPLRGASGRSSLISKELRVRTVSVEEPPRQSQCLSLKVALRLNKGSRGWRGEQRPEKVPSPAFTHGPSAVKGPLLEGLVGVPTEALDVFKDPSGLLSPLKCPRQGLGAKPHPRVCLVPAGEILSSDARGDVC